MGSSATGLWAADAPATAPAAGVSSGKSGEAVVMNTPRRRLEGAAGPFIKDLAGLKLWAGEAAKSVAASAEANGGKPDPATVDRLMEALAKDVAQIQGIQDRAASTGRSLKKLGDTLLAESSASWKVYKDELQAKRDATTEACGNALHEAEVAHASGDTIGEEIAEREALDAMRDGKAYDATLSDADKAAHGEQEVLKANVAAIRSGISQMNSTLSHLRNARQIAASRAVLWKVSSEKEALQADMAALAKSMSIAAEEKDLFPSSLSDGPMGPSAPVRLPGLKSAPATEAEKKELASLREQYRQKQAASK